MAERVGFEPTIPLQVCRISSAVHSTTLPPLRIVGRRLLSAGRYIAGVGRGRKGAKPQKIHLFVTVTGIPLTVSSASPIAQGAVA